MSSNQNNRSSDQPDVDVVVVGAGFAGMYGLHRFRKLGMRVKVFEAGSDVGGTWFWNRYPGARCDVESLEYSYGFSEELQQEWKWPERFSAQPDILKYLNHVADRFDLRRDIQMNTRVTEAHYDEEKNVWVVKTNRGDCVTARFFLVAAGNLSLPRVPDFKGLDTFRGKWYHTGMWPHEKVDFTGLRVGVIGTGSSGIQLIPVVAEQAAHLHVFQRTANYSVPSNNRVTDPEVERKHKATYAEWRRLAYETSYGIAGFPAPEKKAFDDSPEERQKLYQHRWVNGTGNISFLSSYKDLITNKEANETACEFAREKIREKVKDPKVAEILCPKDHYIGTKRLCLDTNYYETFNRSNVTLVDVKASPIEEIIPSGVKTKDASYALDALIFATGFDAMTGAIFDIDIVGKKGLKLKAKWSDGPKTYLGIMTADFPNLFMVTGPGSPSVKTNMVPHIEQHVNWIADCVSFMESQQYSTIDANKQKESEWVQHVNDVANSTLYPLANSWYVGANIPGKTRIFMPYVGGLDRYKKICDEIADKHYEGFSLN